METTLTIKRQKVEYNLVVERDLERFKKEILEWYEVQAQDKIPVVHHRLLIGHDETENMNELFSEVLTGCFIETQNQYPNSIEEWTEETFDEFDEDVVTGAHYYEEFFADDVAIFLNSLNMIFIEPNVLGLPRECDDYNNMNICEVW